MAVLAFTAFAAWCAALTVFDLRQRRLPNALTAPAVPVILGYAACTAQFTAALLGAALLSSAYLLIHLAAPGALGAGDVKLAAGVGAAAALGGAQAWVWAALGAPALTAAYGLGTLVARRVALPAGVSAPRAEVPHGPSMCLATLLALPWSASAAA